MRSTVQQHKNYRLLHRSAGWLKVVRTGIIAIVCLALAIVLLVPLLKSALVVSPQLIFGVLLGLIALWHIYEASQAMLSAMSLGQAELICSDWPLRIGEEIDITFRQLLKGPTEADIRVARLLCTETVSYRDGSGGTTTTAKVIGEISLPQVLPLRRTGVLEVAWRILVPLGYPPSFTTGKNQISWSLAFTLDVTNMPDVTVTFPVLVLA